MVGLSADEGEFNDEPEDDDEMAAFKELVFISPAYLFCLELLGVHSLILPFGGTEIDRGSG